MPIGSAPTSLAALVTAQTKHTLDLFSKVVPIDEDTRDKLIAAEVDINLTNADAVQIAAASHLSQADLQKIRGPEFDDYRQTIIDLLGPENGPTFISLYDATGLNFGAIADDFAGRVAAAGEPLTAAAQVSVTINLMNNLRDPAYPSPPVVLPNGVPVSEQLAYDSAAKVLSPTQLTIFKQLWAEHPYPKAGGR